MEQKILWDLYCFQCTLQFEKKSLYDMHQLIIHKYNNNPKHFANEIKSEKEDKQLSNVSRDIQSKHIADQRLPENETSINEEKYSTQCEFCEKSFTSKQCKNKHVASVHEGKKPFKCDRCNYSCSQQCNLKRHISSVHEGRKQFKCDRCDYKCPQKSSLKQHISNYCQ